MRKGVFFFWDRVIKIKYYYLASTISIKGKIVPRDQTVKETEQEDISKVALKKGEKDLRRRKAQESGLFRFRFTWVEVGADQQPGGGGGGGAGAGHGGRREANAGEEESEVHPRPRRCARVLATRPSPVHLFPPPAPLLELFFAFEKTVALLVALQPPAWRFFLRLQTCFFFLSCGCGVRGGR
jgi:hypothetical protein